MPEPAAINSLWNNKENNKFILNKSCWGNTEKENQQTNKSKTNRLLLNGLLVPSKRKKRRVCRCPTPSDTSSDSDTDLAVPLAEDFTEEEQDADCVFCTGRFSEDHNGEERIRCAKHFRWAHTLCAGMEEDSVCEVCLFCF